MYLRAEKRKLDEAEAEMLKEAKQKRGQIFKR